MSRLLFGVALCSISLGACAAGGPLGIDHRLNRDDESGFWSRDIQKAIWYGSIITPVSGALIEGTETRVGLTFWRAAESAGITAIETGVLKKVFTRPRPSEINNPDLWFQGNGYQSFPSGETALAMAVVTPFILEYAHDEPGVLALAAIPTYVAIARLKSQAHWQTDVLTSIALAGTTSYFVSQREHPLTLSFQPGGVFVGLRYRW